MASEVSRENEDFIEQEIAAGRFRDRQEAIDAGLGLLRQQKALTDRLANSRRQLDQGDCLEFDSAELRGLFDDLKKRAGETICGRISACSFRLRPPGITSSSIIRSPTASRFRT